MILPRHETLRPAMNAVQAPVPRTSAGNDRADRTGTWTLVVVLVVAALVAAGLSAVVPSRTEIPGIATAGELTALALPAVRAAVDLSASLTIGWLLAAAWLVPAERDGRLKAHGHRASAAASRSAVVWGAGSLALIPLILSDTLGRPVGEALTPQWVLSGIGALNSVRAALIAAAIALVIAVLARGNRYAGWAGVLMMLALAALVPQADSGHSASSGDHDIAINTMMYHLVGISVWIGGLVAIIGLARWRTLDLESVAVRFAPIALVAYAAVAVSGVANGWIRISRPSDIWSTDYGRLMLIKATLLTMLGIAGWVHRHRTIPKLGGGDRRPFVRWATVEIALMAGTIGVAAALARTATPPALPVAVSEVELTLGFTLDGPPTATALLTDWRFDWLFGTVAVAAVIGYLAAVRRLRRTGIHWPPGRTVAWLLGCLTVLVATSSGIGRYAVGQFSVHMIAHMLLAMLAPILLVMGGPITLALRSLPAAERGRPPGAREMLAALMHSRVLRGITHPLVVFGVFVASFYALYFTPLFATLMSAHVGHLVMNLHFLLVGYLYYWVIIGVDPSPWQPSYLIKLAMLMAALPFHAFFGIAMMNSHSALASGFYGGLALPWVGDLIAEQRLGGAIAWGATEIPTVIVMIALLAQWARSDERAARRSDRMGDRRADDELAAYNRMLERLARRDSGGPGFRR